jgi:hypothetical protein
MLAGHTWRIKQGREHNLSYAMKNRSSFTVTCIDGALSIRHPKYLAPDDFRRRVHFDISGQVRSPREGTPRGMKMGEAMAVNRAPSIGHRRSAVRQRDLRQR